MSTGAANEKFDMSGITRALVGAVAAAAAFYVTRQSGELSWTSSGSGSGSSNRDEETASKSFYSPDKGSLNGNTVVITGASTGLGLESAKRLAVGGCDLILTAPSDHEGRAAVEAVKDYIHRRKIGSKEQLISYKRLQLDNLESVKKVPDTWADVSRVDVLLNNEEVGFSRESEARQITVDGIERKMHSNHLGHFVLTAMLKDKFSENARIINVSSQNHEGEGLRFNYMWKAEPSNSYNGRQSYRQSKLANILFTQELQRKIDEAGLGWTTATLAPGAVESQFSEDRRRINEEAESINYDEWGLSFKMSSINFQKGLLDIVKTDEDGATTQIWLASGADGADIRSKYFMDCKSYPLSEGASDVAASLRLWEESEELSGVKFELKQMGLAKDQ